MANMSTGYGTVSIYAKSLREIAELVYLQYLNEEKVCYSTTLNEVNALSSTLNDNNKTLNDKINTIYSKLHVNKGETFEDCTVCAEFTLSLEGRWSFVNNIDWFFTQAFNLNHLYNHNDEINQLIDKVKQRNYYVCFNFIEEEFGLGFIQEGDVVIKWDGQNQKQTIESKEYQNYDYSAENLIEFGLCSVGEVWDTRYILSNPDVLKNELETNILNGRYQNLADIAKNFDSFIVFLRDNQENFDTYVYLEIEDWFEENLVLDRLN